MNRIPSVLILGALLLTLVGCAKPRIDTSSQEALDRSLEKVKQSVDENRRDELAEAMFYLTMKDQNIFKILGAAAAAPNDQIPLDLMNPLDGMTADEIIEKADDERQKQAEAEITDLRKIRFATTAAENVLSRIVVTAAAFSIRPGILGSEVSMEISVKNLTDIPIARLFFHGRLVSPGRSVPWHEDDFNYQIPGGLEPGEAQHWTLTPNFLSQWDRAGAPRDARFQVTVVAFEDATGNRIPEKPFDPNDAKRLNELLEKYPDLRTPGDAALAPPRQDPAAPAPRSEPLAEAAAEKAAPTAETSSQSEPEIDELTDAEVQAKLGALNAALAAKAEEAQQPQRKLVKVRREYVYASGKTRLYHNKGCPEFDSSLVRVMKASAEGQGVHQHSVCANLLPEIEVQDRWITTAPQRVRSTSSSSSGSPPPTSAMPSRSEVPSAHSETEAPVERKVVAGASMNPPIDKAALRAANDFFDSERKIKESCNRKWPGDADQAAYCYGKQLGAAQALDRGRPFGIDPDEFNRKRVQCYQKWGTDYEMRLYCEGR